VTPQNAAERCEPVILIGRPASPVTDASERLLDGIIVALQDFDTETLLAIADDREEINPGGWMQNLIREYVDVWR
jgi:hypothetical protein